MKIIMNNRGIALVTSLMMTLMCLVISMALLYSLTQNIKSSASQKIYRNVVEASYGGTEVFVNEILPQLFTSTATTTTMNAAKSTLSTSLGVTFNTTTNSSACLIQKLTLKPSDWTSCTSGTDINPKSIVAARDLEFTLSGASGAQYKVYSKIVDTVPGAEYIDPNGKPLLTGGVVESGYGGGGGSTPAHFVYRIEVVGERSVNQSEQGAVSVLYEF